MRAAGQPRFVGAQARAIRAHGNAVGNVAPQHRNALKGRTTRSRRKGRPWRQNRHGTVAVWRLTPYGRRFSPSPQTALPREDLWCVGMCGTWVSSTGLSSPWITLDKRVEIRFVPVKRKAMHA